MYLYRCINLLIITLIYHAAASITQDAKPIPKHAAKEPHSLLRPFQVYAPVLVEKEKGQFVLTDGYHDHKPKTVPHSPSAYFEKQTLMEHSFGNSYGVPYVGSTKPPSGPFNKITLNFTVTSRGRQFDRLARLYLGDTEVWRTSTAEPTLDGIVWTYIKDVTEYSSLFKKPQKLIFELGNIVDDTYTAPFNATLEATFFNAEQTVSVPDLIVPISARQGSAGKASVWQLPKQNATNTFTIPRNVNTATLAISATGQSTEEFWYSNVFSSGSKTFGSGANALYGFSPFREVQLYIDGKLAGVALPFPVIFTGGISPGLWRPIVGIDAFDLRESIIDISPWLPLLCDGKEHTYAIKIAGVGDDGHKGEIVEEVGSYWDVTGKLFLFLDPNNSSVTTGSVPQLTIPPPRITLSSVVGKTANGTNSSLFETISVSRKLQVTSTLRIGNITRPASWTQSYTYSNINSLTVGGANQLTTQLASGYDVSSYGYGRSFSYPIKANTSVDNNLQTGVLTLFGDVHRGQEIVTVGYPIFPTGLENPPQLTSGGRTRPGPQGTWLSTTQNGTAVYSAKGKVANSTGTTSQNFQLQQLTGNITALLVSIARDAAQGKVEPNKWTSGGTIPIYERDVKATNVAVVKDVEVVHGEATTYQVQDAQAPSGGSSAAFKGVRAMLGRGPPSQGSGNDASPSASAEGWELAVSLLPSSNTPSHAFTTLIYFLSRAISY